MKTMRYINLLVFSIIATACGGRNPNLSKSQLAEVINGNIKIETQATAEAVALPDTGYVPPVGAKYNENRAIDPSAPPVVLKVALPQGAKSVLKLSEIGKSVTYVTLTMPTAEDFFLSETPVQIIGDKWSQQFSQSTIARKMGNYYFTQDMLAVRLFDDKGVFIRNLVESEFEGERSIDEVSIHADGFKQGFVQSVFGSSLLLAKASSTERLQGTYNTDTKELIMTPVKRSVNGSFIDHNTLFSTSSRDPKIVALSFSSKGDTLCKFGNYTEAPELNVKVFSNSDRSFFYRADDKLFFRQAYCDTVFRVESASRIVPAFRFDFGAKRASYEEGVRAKTAGKLLPWSLTDVKNKLLFLFSEGRDCPNCREKNEVKFFGNVYDKATGKATSFDVPVNNPESAIIENDIDGGLPVLINTVWVEGNYLLTTFTKKQAAALLKSKSIPADMAGKLKAQTDTLAQNQMLVMVVELK